MVSCFPPHLPTGAHPLHTPLCRSHLFLVGCCVSHCQSSAVQRQRCIFIFLPLDLPPPNNYTASPPHVLPQSRLFYDDPLTADTNFWLVVAFNIWTAATQGQDPIPLSHYWRVAFWCPKQENQPRRLQTRHRALAVDPWGVAAPRFGGATALPMEREGNATGG